MVGGLGARAVPLDHQAALCWPIALFDDRRVRIKLLDVDRKCPDRLDVLVFQIGVVPQFSDHGFEKGHGQVSYSCPALCFLGAHGLKSWLKIPAPRGNEKENLGT